MFVGSECVPVHVVTVCSFLVPEAVCLVEPRIESQKVSRHRFIAMGNCCKKQPAPLARRSIGKMVSGSDCAIVARRGVSPTSVATEKSLPGRNEAAEPEFKQLIKKLLSASIFQANVAVPLTPILL